MAKAKHVTRFKVGDAVDLRVAHTRNRYRSYYLHDARVESVSLCGRYLRVSGVRSWGYKRHMFEVTADRVKVRKKKRYCNEEEI